MLFPSKERKKLKPLQLPFECNGIKLFHSYNITFQMRMLRNFSSPFRSCSWKILNKWKAVFRNIVTDICGKFSAFISSAFKFLD